MPKLVNSPSLLWIWPLLLLLASDCVSARGQALTIDGSTQAFYRGDYAKASELGKAHLRRFPNDVPSRVILARAELAQNKFDEAFEDLQNALALDPKNIDALYYLSLMAKQLSRRENERLFSLAPDYFRVYQLQGEAALAAANQSEAEEEFQKALKANPRSSEVLTKMAELKRSQRKFDEAIAYYTQAQQFGPLKYEIAYGLGTCYTFKQEYPRAIEWFQKTVTLAPEFVEGQFSLGDALFKNGQFEGAIRELKAALKLEPGRKQGYYLIGRAYSKLGRPDEAKAAFQKFDELNRAEPHREAKPEGVPRPKQR